MARLVVISRHPHGMISAKTELAVRRAAFTSSRYRIMRYHLRFVLHLLVWSLAVVSAVADEAETKTRGVIEKALLSEGADQATLIRSLTADGGPFAAGLLQLWKEGAIYLYKDSTGQKIAVTLAEGANGSGEQAAIRLSDGLPLKDAAGKEVLLKASGLEAAETDSVSRKAMKDVMEMASLADPDAAKRIKAVQSVGMEQNFAKLPLLQARQALEKDPTVIKAITEAVALMQLKSEKMEERIAAATTLGSIASIGAQDSLKSVMAEAKKANQPELATAANSALASIASHITTVNTFGTMFRGLSKGSILLVAAIGLAITFGLMGVINMAHGELIVVGAYTTYIVQNVFAQGMALSPLGYSIHLPGMNVSAGGQDLYFLVALPMSFIMAALVGIALERTVIRFLYTRPLESLLATWGVSLVLQQIFRLVFGANNVQVSSPTWLSGNWTVNDITFGWNRVFVIGFAAFIIFLTWAVLNKTSLGMLIRAVMQNRDMAACMGVRTERVNMMTFGFGSGLAGLAGAFLSQIGNVGPSLGQDYIVDAFMTVVVGGVGNLIGTVVSALGIGVIDQSLQQILGNPVLGKILVLGAIILFLQWRPAGIFVTRSRSIES
ncbi:MAG: urea transporter permease subunit UrtB [Verrucomicrobiota bacterium]|jgi:urea transport system permease protein